MSVFRESENAIRFRFERKMTMNQELNDKTTTTTGEMAELLGISERRLQQLAADGWIEGKVGRDRWLVVATTRSFINNIVLAERRA